MMAVGVTRLAYLNLKRQVGQFQSDPGGDLIRGEEWMAPSVAPTATRWQHSCLVRRSCVTIRSVHVAGLLK